MFFGSSAISARQREGSQVSASKLGRVPNLFQEPKYRPFLCTRTVIEDLCTRRTLHVNLHLSPRNGPSVVVCKDGPAISCCSSIAPDRVWTRAAPIDPPASPHSTQKLLDDKDWEALAYVHICSGLCHPSLLNNRSSIQSWKS